MAIVSSGSDGTYTAVYLPTKKNYGVLIQLEFDVAPAFSADDFSDYSTAFFAPANRGTLKTTLLNFLHNSLNLTIDNSRVNVRYESASSLSMLFFFANSDADTIEYYTSFVNRIVAASPSGLVSSIQSVIPTGNPQYVYGNPIFSQRYMPSTCLNNVADGHESDVDCGGADCISCEPTYACLSDSDCEQLTYCAVSTTGVFLPNSCSSYDSTVTERDVVKTDNAYSIGISVWAIVSMMLICIVQQF